MTDFVCGTGGWNGPKPGDPSNNATLSATSAFGGINVNWTYPSVRPYAVAHTILYRSLSSDFATASQRAIVSGNQFFDSIDNSNTYYYWITIVSVNGTVGELIGPASATARPLVETLLDTLGGSIDEGVLALALKRKLDDLSILNSNLANEIFDRETGDTSFAQALADVQAGIAEAHTFITTEMASRVSANEAIAEQINLVAAALGSDIAAVVVTSEAWISPFDILDGKVTNIGALYTVQLTADNMVGGFGVFNDGTSVEAGFDVDTFWVGRTNADKIKPFVIRDGVVYIDKARIHEADIDTLKIANGAISTPIFIDASNLFTLPTSTYTNFGATPAIDATYGNVMITVICYYTPGTGGSLGDLQPLYFRIFRNGSVIRNIVGPANGSLLVESFMDTPGGSAYYSADVVTYADSGTASIGQRSILILGIKR